MRYIMRPFKPGDRLKDHAAPIGEVLQQLQTQLAEYQALKEQLAGRTSGITSREGISSLPEPSDNSDSSSNSTSSSFLQLPVNHSSHFNLDYDRAQS